MGLTIATYPPSYPMIYTFIPLHPSSLIPGSFTRQAIPTYQGPSISDLLSERCLISRLGSFASQEPGCSLASPVGMSRCLIGA